MKPELLDTLKDDDLRAIIGRAEELLKQHDRERKDKALEQARAVEDKAREEARAILEAAGLNLRDVSSKGKSRKSGKRPVYHSGRRYQHPENKGLVWSARGQKPAWLRQLEKEGSRAVELPGDVSQRVA